MANSTAQTTSEMANPAREVFIFAITLVSFANMILLYVPGIPLSSSQREVLRIVDGILTLFFIIDFLLRLRAAPSKRRYMRHERGWLDLLGSLPLLRVLRVFRLVRAWSIMRQYGPRRMARLLLRDRAQSALYLIALLVILVLESAGTMVLRFEADAPGANIVTGGDALWWGIVTVTTVGYGDEYPITAGGRVVGVFLLLTGVILFATLSGFLANAFLSEPGGDAAPPADPARDEVLALLRTQQEEIRALHVRLDALGIDRGPPPSGGP
jgi:voltage-gated potassium channel